MPRSARSTRTASRSGPSRARWPGTAGPTACAACRSATSTSPARPDDPRRGPRPRDAPDPERPARRRGPPRADRLRRRLPDARRHVHPRLHPRRRPGRRAPARDRGDRARRPAHRRGARLQPRQRRRLLDPRGPRRGRGRGRSAHPLHRRPAPGRGSAGPRRRAPTGPRRSWAGGPPGRAWRRWSARPGRGASGAPGRLRGLIREGDVARIGPAVGRSDGRGPSRALYESPGRRGAMRDPAGTPFTPSRGGPEGSPTDQRPRSVPSGRVDPRG